MQPDDKILEIGTGSGYQCLVLLELAAEVYTIEYNQNLYTKAVKMFQDLKAEPKTFCGDGSEGLPDYAPFTKILVTAGAPVVPKSLIEQLTVGGILVIPVGDEKSQKMVRITRVEPNEYTKEEFDNFKFVPLLGKSGWNL